MGFKADRILGRRLSKRDRDYLRFSGVVGRASGGDGDDTDEETAMTTMAMTRIMGMTKEKKDSKGLSQKAEAQLHSMN